MAEVAEGGPAMGALNGAPSGAELREKDAAVLLSHKKDHPSATWDDCARLLGNSATAEDCEKAFEAARLKAVQEEEELPPAAALPSRVASPASASDAAGGGSDSDAGGGAKSQRRLTERQQLALALQESRAAAGGSSDNDSSDGSSSDGSGSDGSEEEDSSGGEEEEEEDGDSAAGRKGKGAGRGGGGRPASGKRRRPQSAARSGERRKLSRPGSASRAALASPSGSGESGEKENQTPSWVSVIETADDINQQMKEAAAVVKELRGRPTRRPNSPPWKMMQDRGPIDEERSKRHAEREMRRMQSQQDSFLRQLAAAEKREAKAKARAEARASAAAEGDAASAPTITTPGKVGAGAGGAGEGAGAGGVATPPPLKGKDASSAFTSTPVEVGTVAQPPAAGSEVEAPATTSPVEGKVRRRVDEGDALVKPALAALLDNTGGGLMCDETLEGQLAGEEAARASRGARGGEQRKERAEKDAAREVPDAAEVGASRARPTRAAAGGEQAEESSRPVGRRRTEPVEAPRAKKRSRTAAPVSPTAVPRRWERDSSYVARAPAPAVIARRMPAPAAVARTPLAYQAAPAPAPRPYVPPRPAKSLFALGCRMLRKEDAAQAARCKSLGVDTVPSADLAYMRGYVRRLDAKEVTTERDAHEAGQIKAHVAWLAGEC